MGLGVAFMISITSSYPRRPVGILISVISRVGCISLGRAGGRYIPTWGVSRNWLIWLQHGLGMNHWAISFSSSPLGHIKEYERCWLSFIVFCKNCLSTGSSNRSVCVKISKKLTWRRSQCTESFRRYLKCEARAMKRTTEIRQDVFLFCLPFRSSQHGNTVF